MYFKVPNISWLLNSFETTIYMYSFFYILNMYATTVYYVLVKTLQHMYTFYEQEIL